MQGRASMWLRETLRGTWGGVAGEASRVTRHTTQVTTSRGSKVAAHTITRSHRRKSLNQLQGEADAGTRGMSAGGRAGGKFRNPRQARDLRIKVKGDEVPEYSPRPCPYSLSFRNGHFIQTDDELSVNRNTQKRVRYNHSYITACWQLQPAGKRSKGRGRGR